ncbi:hypothetical protein KBI33_01340 [Candidatus Shapirobacteria bacterium]|nr:hypothetical protein [Candidatus Shapirobacteria bacterium]
MAQELNPLSFRNFFSKTEFAVLVGICLAFLALTVYLFFSFHRRLSFWPLWFLASLSPVLSPFGVSWIIAERYVYLGVAGLTVMASYLLSQLLKKETTKPWGEIIIFLLIIALGTRTITRNFDWGNQDNLWLAAAKTSPSSRKTIII